MGETLAISIGDLKDGDMPLLERIDVALRRITGNEGQMRIPPEATDVDMVLCSCRDRIAKLEADVHNAGQRNDEMAANLPTWIHATVLLPKSGEFVLAWDGQRMIRAMYAKRFTEAANPGGEEEATEYSDELDGYFLLEGWFEHNAFEAIHWAVDRPVTHWMPLPAPPAVKHG